jgi:hypothetical protein
MNLRLEVNAKLMVASLEFDLKNMKKEDIKRSVTDSINLLIKSTLIRLRLLTKDGNGSTSKLHQTTPKR